MGVQNAATTRASRNRIGAINGRVSADGSPGRTDDGRVVRDFKLEPTARKFKAERRFLGCIRSREGFFWY